MLDDQYFIINYGLPLAGFLITLIAEIFVKISYSKYKDVMIRKNMSGQEAARTILDKNGLKDIKIVETSGDLTDHYDPRIKTIKLSHDIYNDSSVAAVSVAAHECGHAIQDKQGYFFLRFRSALVPFVNFSSKIGYLVVVIGLIFGALNIAMIGIILLLAMLLFQLVTLPVEFNASSRAKKQLLELKILDKDEVGDSSTMLRAAAFTYVASLMSTLLQILRLALIVLGRRDND